ncbi:uncharacterized protein LOC115789569 [Archocentrus centrarchus]|uniref:uncharacterized protein LOC115789569 n=1 Tax=Archocentrus centrarchus TaxID=63155 RepID=UPI0011E9DCE3|nr:uncharacterized protein LOC115789569 [Archocentrus centrarchus]
MEHERERGNLHRCLKLAKEREELERELQWYTLERNSTNREQSDLKRRENGGDELVWEYKSSTLPHRCPPGSKENRCLSPSFLSSSSAYWETHPLVSPPTLIQSRTRLSASSPATPSHLKSGNRHSSQFFPKQTAFQSEEAGSFSKDRLTLPHLPLKHQRHERVGAAPESYNDSPQSTGLDMQTNDSCSEAQRQNNLSHGSLSTLSFYSNKYTERSNSALDAVPDSSKVEVVLPKRTDEDLCVEMSVDEPEYEACVMQPTKPMLHQRIASHVQQGHSLTRRGWHDDVRRSTSFNCQAPVSVQDIFRVPDCPQPLEPEIWKGVSQGSKISLSKQRSQSLDLRRQKESDFLTPDAWIESLSQENISAASSCPPDSLFQKPQSSAPRKISRSPANDPSATQYATYLPPAVDSKFSMSHPERLITNHDVPCHYKPRREAGLLPHAATMPGDYQEAMKEAGGYLESVKGATICLLPNTDTQEALELEAEGYDGVPQSGSNYSSYASSGRGSMEPSNGRLSMCHLSPTLMSSPETIEDTQGNTEDMQNPQMEPSQRRKVSVDENYEWDATDFCSQPADHDGLLPSLHLPKPDPRCSLPSMQFSTKALKNCSQVSLLPGHQSSCSAEPEPDTVLF